MTELHSGRLRRLSDYGCVIRLLKNSFLEDSRLALMSQQKSSKSSLWQKTLGKLTFEFKDFSDMLVHIDFRRTQ